MEETKQADNVSIKEETTETIKYIKGIEEVIQSEELDSYEYGHIYSLTVTKDKRIASGGYDGNISISSYDVNEKKWTREIHKKKAHDGDVYSFCTLNGNRLLSGSYDCSIKVWSLSDVELTLTKAINEHTNPVPKIIPLSKKRLASCSYDKTVKIWKDDKTHKYINT